MANTNKPKKTIKKMDIEQVSEDNPTPYRRFRWTGQSSYVECPEKGCKNYAKVECFGYCQFCWLKLEPHERAILKGEEPPLRPEEWIVKNEVVTHEKEVIHEKEIIRETPVTIQQKILMPEHGILWQGLGLLWKVGISLGLTYLIFFKH